RLSSSSGKNSCPLNTGIPIESLGIELEFCAFIRDPRPNMSDARALLNERFCGTTLWRGSILHTLCIVLARSSPYTYYANVSNCTGTVRQARLVVGTFVEW